MPGAWSEVSTIHTYHRGGRQILSATCGPPSRPRGGNATAAGRRAATLRKVKLVLRGRSL